jgi:hypothetical protein
MINVRRVAAVFGLAGAVIIGGSVGVHALQDQPSPSGYRLTGSFNTGDGRLTVQTRAVGSGSTEYRYELDGKPVLGTLVTDACAEQDRLEGGFQLSKSEDGWDVVGLLPSASKSALVTLADGRVIEVPAFGAGTLVHPYYELHTTERPVNIRASGDIPPSPGCSVGGVR